MCEKRKTSATTGTANIVCPYFVAHGSREIVCEGLIDDCRNVMKFKTEEGKTFHQTTYCENQYKRCEVCCSIRHWRYED